MNKSNYRGVVVPMVTPVTQDGQLDAEAVKRIIDFFAENKVSPLLMGTTGEGNSVSQADGQLFVETAVKAADGRILIYAGLTGNCFSEQVRQAEVYTALGADVIVATLPTYYALTEEQMYEYYKTLADCITGPLMLYNILATTHMSIPVDVIKRLADHPNIVGLSVAGQHRVLTHWNWEATVLCPLRATMCLRCSASSSTPPWLATGRQPTVCRTRPTR